MKETEVFDDIVKFLSCMFEFSQRYRNVIFFFSISWFFMRLLVLVHATRKYLGGLDDIAKGVNPDIVYTSWFLQFGERGMVDILMNVIYSLLFTILFYFVNMLCSSEITTLFSYSKSTAQPKMPSIPSLSSIAPRP